MCRRRKKTRSLPERRPRPSPAEDHAGFPVHIDLLRATPRWLSKLPGYRRAFGSFGRADSVSGPGCPDSPEHGEGNSLSVERVTSEDFRPLDAGGEITALRVEGARIRAAGSVEISMGCA